MATVPPRLAAAEAWPFERALRRLEKLAERAESRWGRWGAAALWAVVLIAIAAVYVTPALHGVNHGDLYTQLANVPFAPSNSCNPLQSRILTPAVAHILGFTGWRYILFPLLMGALLLALVYAGFRRENFEPSECIAAAALIAFSSPLLFLLHFQGYTDTTTYVLVYAVLLCADRPLIWPVLFAAAVLNHESALFLLPWLLLFTLWRPQGWKKTAVGFALLAALLLGVRSYQNEIYRLCPGAFSPATYFERRRIWANLRGIALFFPWGFFEAFKLFWFLPLAAATVLWARARKAEALLLTLPVLGALAQLPLGTDTSRLMGLAFPAVLLSLTPLREAWGAGFNQRLWMLILLNFLVPQYYVGQHLAIYLIPLPVSLLLHLFFGIDPWAASLWLGR
jgi:hypothetical protein